MLEKRVDYLEDGMRVTSLQEQEIQKAVGTKISKVLGGRNSIAYRKISRRVYANFWKEFKNHFEIRKYGDLPKGRFTDAMIFILIWKTEKSLKLEIQKLNEKIEV